MGILVLVTVCAVLFSRSPNREQRALEETRRALRQQGFKTDLSDFDLSTSPEERSRAAVLATTSRAALTNRSRPILIESPAFINSIGKDAAIVVWRCEKLEGNYGNDLWPDLRDRVATNQTRMDAARQAALSGPIRFELIEPPNALLPYLADIKNLTSAFGVGTILALRDGRADSAWTNLCAATRLVTAYAPEPIDVSHLVRFACAGIAYDTSWNALQSTNWTDAQLAELQREWEHVDFFSGLPMTAALSRVNSAMMCQIHRREPRETPTGMMFKELLRSPRDAWPFLSGQWRQLQYRHHGSFEDEQSLLLYYRDREVELRRAVQCGTWSDMSQLPGVTNFVPFQSKHRSAVQAMFNQKQLMLRLQGQGEGLLGRAAVAEAHRRLIITALALERYRGQHGAYPKALQELAPQLVRNPPEDFMDGKPLRYRLTDDGHFVLYSVGLDCTDDGGKMPLRGPRGLTYQNGRPIATPPEIDVVWPRPATAVEVEHFLQEQINARQKQADQAEDFEATEQWRRTARRQAQVERILAAKPESRAFEPNYRGPHSPKRFGMKTPPAQTNSRSTNC